MKAPSFSFLVAAILVASLPACGSPESTTASIDTKLVTPPEECGNGIPTCRIAVDSPTQVDLNASNHENVVYSAVDGGLALFGGGGGGAVVDTDGDGVPDPADDCVGTGWRLPCDGDDTNDGVYETMDFDATGGATVRADIRVTGTIRKGDAYILMDASGSMTGEQAQLITDLTTGTFVTGCPEAVDSGLVGAMRCVVPDVWFGLGQFNEIPLVPHADPFEQTPYHHHLDLTNNIQYLVDAVSALTVKFNSDDPEAPTQALYSVVTGQGLGPWVPNRGACPSTPSGRWGYPCFRSGALPMIILFTDEDMYNGPRPGSPTYTNPPFDGTVGLGTRIPPVEQDPAMLYSSDALSAYNLGDLTTKSVTVMGSNANLGEDFVTRDKFGCDQCSFFGCYGDGKDGAVRFSLTAPTSTSVSGWGTFYPMVNVALFDATGTAVDCDHGPGSGNSWGEVTQTLGAGTWFAVSDAKLGLFDDASERRGPFQLRIQTTPDDPSWQTADLPIPWTNVETELLAAGVKIVSIISLGESGLVGGQLSARPDAEALGIVTGSVDQSGNPYVEEIAADGTGLTTAVLDAMQALVGDTRRDISVVAEDNPATATVDESNFVTQIEATVCPSTGASNCLGGVGTPMCLGCLSEAQVEFSFQLKNDVVPQAPTPQVFEFDVVAYADGITEVDRVPVRIMVPPSGGGGGSFTDGFYQNDYDSTVTCNLPQDRPYWDTLTWSATTPGDSAIEFEIFTADTQADLDSAAPVSVRIPTDTTANPIDLNQLLVGGGHPNLLLYLRIRANLRPSSDGLTTPILAGWETRFDCRPSE